MPNDTLNQGIVQSLDDFVYKGNAYLQKLDENKQCETYDDRVQAYRDADLKKIQDLCTLIYESLRHSHRSTKSKQELLLNMLAKLNEVCDSGGPDNLEAHNRNLKELQELIQKTPINQLNWQAVRVFLYGFLVIAIPVSMLALATILPLSPGVFVALYFLLPQVPGLPLAFEWHTFLFNWKFQTVLKSINSIGAFSSESKSTEEEASSWLQFTFGSQETTKRYSELSNDLRAKFMARIFTEKTGQSYQDRIKELQTNPDIANFERFYSLIEYCWSNADSGREKQQLIDILQGLINVYDNPSKEKVDLFDQLMNQIPERPENYHYSRGQSKASTYVVLGTVVIFSLFPLYNLIPALCIPVIVIGLTLISIYAGCKAVNHASFEIGLQRIKKVPINNMGFFSQSSNLSTPPEQQASQHSDNTAPLSTLERVASIELTQ